MTPIRDLAEQIRGVTYGKDEASSVPGPGRVAVLRAGNIQDSGLVLEDLVYVPETRVSDKQLLRKNDIVIATSSGSLDVVGKAAATPQDLGMAFGAFCKVLRPRSGIEPRYFAHYFRTSQYRYAVRQMAAGANINNLRNEHLDDLLVPMPPREEQRRIADILDKADAIRRKRKEAIALTDELVDSAFLEMFGDPGANPMEWPVKPLADAFSEDPRIGTLVPAGDQGGMPIVRVGELGGFNVALERCKRAHLALTDQERFLLRSGDVVLARAIGSEHHLGKASVFQECDEPVAFDSHVMRLRFRREYLDPYFFAVWLRSAGGRRRFMREAGRTAVQFNINGKQIARIQIPLPPFGQQTRFRAVFDRVRDLVRKESDSLQESERLFASLVSEAFSASEGRAVQSC